MYWYHWVLMIAGGGMVFYICNRIGYEMDRVVRRRYSLDHSKEEPEGTHCV